MATDAVTITTSSATLVLIAERLVAYFIIPRLRSSRSTQEGATSGDKAPSYWRQEFRAAIDEKLDQRILPILERQTVILESVAKTQEGMASLVEQLAEKKRRRG